MHRSLLRVQTGLMWVYGLASMGMLIASLVAATTHSGRVFLWILGLAITPATLYAVFLTFSWAPTRALRYCAMCGFDLRGVSSNYNCPECGQPQHDTRAQGRRHALQRDIPRAVWIPGVAGIITLILLFIVSGPERRAQRLLEGYTFLSVLTLVATVISLRFAR